MVEHNKDPQLKRVLCKINEEAKYLWRLHLELSENLIRAVDVYHDSGRQEHAFDKEGDILEDNVGDIFVKLKVNLLIYAPFVILCANAEKTIETLRTNENMSATIEKLELFLYDEMRRTSKKTLPVTLNALLSFPFQHILR